MKVAGVHKVSLIDYPDRIAATIFLAGCNFDCGYCHNRWMIREDEVAGAITLEALVDWLGTRIGLLDGVCLSGGEPTLHGAVVEFARCIKSMGFAVKLDTNGARPAMLARLLQDGLLDYVAMDLKAPLDARYDKVAGVHVAIHALEESLGLLRAGGVSYELRTTIGPQLTPEDLIEMAHAVQPDEAWFLQPFEATEGVREKGPALALVEIEALYPTLQAIATGARLRGA